MKKSTAGIIITGLVALVLSIITGAAAAVLLAGAAKQKIDRIDFTKYSNEIQEWVDENITSGSGSGVVVNTEDNQVVVGANGIHVSTEDGSKVDIGADGIRVND